MMRSAKSIMTNVIAKTVCSIPGYHILESYRDRICASLPDDYNNTALRLQTLIGASDHMIQWILTGDMSKANHRIYQVVLVYVCFEPHFIKFCDIMEVLAAGSMTVGYIVELRETLIKQLYTDGHITAEEAAEFTSKKLFKMPIAVQPNISATIMITVTSSDFSTDLCMGTVKTTTNTTLSANAQLNSVSSGASTSCTVALAVTSNEGLQKEKYVNDAMTIVSLKSSCHANGRIPHQIPIVSSKIESMYSSTTTDALSSVNDVQESSSIKGTSSTTDFVSSNALVHEGTGDEQSLCVSQHTESGANGGQSVTDSDAVHQLQLPIANSVTPVSSCDELVDKTSGLVISTSSQDESITTVASGGLEIQPPDVSTMEFGSKEVYDILKAKDFAIVKSRYDEILSCFPENFEATMNCLQNHLSDSDICEILSLASGQNQKILNFLILRLKNKEDLLDFCDSLEKIDGASPSLKVIAEQLRKEAIEMISNSAPSTSESSQTAAAAAPPAKPPRKIIPFHPKLLEIPEAMKPFDRCLLGDDSEGLAALKKCYSILIENLPSNHLISLVRLQDVAIIPEEVVDSIVPSPSAEIGNKMIINYLIGLIHTEEHIITFCYFAERMLGEFEKCIFILNLRNRVLMSQKCEMINDDANATFFTAEKEKPFNASVDISCDELRTQYADQPDIRALIKAEKPLIFYQPFLHECGAMVGYLKCILMNSHKSTDDDTQISSGVTDEVSPEKSMKLVKGFIKRDYLKEYAFSLSDEQGTRPSKQQYLGAIEILFRESSKAGVMIYYTGCGEEGTGNWCFQDGMISFNDILSLYNKYLKERLLVIYADCSYSGQWALEYANYLDKMGIGACGHQIAKQKKFLKIFTSCRPNQKADAKTYATKALNFNEEDDSLWVYTNLQLSSSQTTYGCNFSKIQCLSLEGPSAPCQLSKIPKRCHWKWRDIVDVEYNNRPGSRVFTVRGKDKGRQAWHIVLVEQDLLETFRETVNSGTVDVAKFGYVIKSGWGKDPPDEIVKLLKKNA